MKSFPLFASLLVLAGCNVAVNDGKQEEATSTQRVAIPDTSLTFEDVRDTGAPQPPRPILKAQVALDRLGFSPGVIDGKEGQSYHLALRGFQEANDLPVTGRLDQATAQALGRQAVPETRLVRIPAAFAQGPFVPDLPKEAAAQAKLPALGYRTLTEALAERFHTTPEMLVALNPPDTKIGAGAVIRVPNTAEAPVPSGPDDRGWNRTLQMLGVSADQPAAAKVVVDKSDGVLRAFDDAGKLIAQFPATMGSSHDPLPIGTWKIQGISRNPDFHYNPKLFWDVSDNKKAVTLKPGPNGPVGVVWLDLSKPHYGIHGTSEPQTIGRAESHGCVRLTNWDAAKLAGMVKPGTPAIFQE